MNDKKIAILLISVVIGLGGLFKQVQVNADSYTSGSSPSTLQSTLATGNTGSLTTDNTMELTATSTYEGLSIDHGLGAGYALEITGHAGTGEMIYAERSGSDGTGKVAWFYSDRNADVFEVDSLGNGDGIYISKPSGAGAALNISNLGTGNAVSIASNLAGAGSDKAAIYSWALGANQEALFLDKGANSGNSITAQTNISGYIKTFQVGSGGNITAGYSGTTGSVLDTTNIFYGLTDDSTGGMKLTNTHNDANGINLIFDRKPSTADVYEVAANGDDIANMSFQGFNDTATATVYTYGQITSEIVSAATGTMDGGMYLRVMDDGTLEAPITMVGGTDMITAAWPITATSIQFANEVMDVYDEGTYTPLLSGSSTAGTCTATSTYGFYTQVGNVINADINITISNCDPNPVGIMRVSLPVAPSVNANYKTGCAVGLLSTYTLSSASNIMTPTITSGGYVLLREEVVGGGTYADAPLDETFILQMHCTYLTD